jgi:predicted outer membrane repeat protein
VGPIVSISNLTISYGYAGEDPYNTDGGGVLNLYSTVTLTNDIISGNTAPLKGGGIYNKGTLQILNCKIASNRAIRGDGGGVYSDSRWTVFVSATSISGNQAGTEGGGIAQFIFAAPDTGWTRLVNGSQVSGNSAKVHGGGIYGDGGMGSVSWSSNSSVQGNSPENRYCDHSAC